MRAQLISRTYNRDVPKYAISPCGICRQVLREFCAQDMPILLIPADYTGAESTTGGEKVEVRETTMGEILPNSFGPEDLERERL